MCMSLEDAIQVFEHKLHLTLKGQGIESAQLYDAMRVMLATAKKSTPILCKVVHYHTELEGRGDEDRYKMLSDLMAADVEKMSPRVPRVLHILGRKTGGYSYLTAIVVWECNDA